jgi:hypothetical protein
MGQLQNVTLLQENVSVTQTPVAQATSAMKILELACKMHAPHHAQVLLLSVPLLKVEGFVCAIQHHVESERCAVLLGLVFHSLVIQLATERDRSVRQEMARRLAFVIIVLATLATSAFLMVSVGIHVQPQLNALRTFQVVSKDIAQIIS